MFKIFFFSEALADHHEQKPELAGFYRRTAIWKRHQSFCSLVWNFEGAKIKIKELLTTFLDIQNLFCPKQFPNLPQRTPQSTIFYL